MKPASRRPLRATAALACSMLWALAALSATATAVQARSANSPQAIEAVRQHRAEQAQQGRHGSANSSQAGQYGAHHDPSPTDRASGGVAGHGRPFSSGANPRANPNAGLKSCLDSVGINPAARDRCMRRYCEGRWGQGDCPEGGDLINRSGGNSSTPLGQCLRQAGANPFKRNACGWRHCNKRWDAPECVPFKARQPEIAN